jgi:hypothetical protein
MFHKQGTFVCIQLIPVYYSICYGSAMWDLETYEFEHSSSAWYSAVNEAWGILFDAHLCIV